MTIIVGLGNPGKKFEDTRHNVGFMAVDAFARKNNFPEFKIDKKSNSLISSAFAPKGTPGSGETKENENILLAKPQTFMNDSGKTVRSLISNFKFQISNLIVVHDDVDLPVGKMKIVKERGSAGHKGVESIIKNIGNDGLIRFRIGIGPDTDTKAEKIVLKNFSAEEQKTINDIIKKITDAIDVFIKEGLDKTMNEFNT